MYQYIFDGYAVIPPTPNCSGKDSTLNAKQSAAHLAARYRTTCNAQSWCAICCMRLIAYEEGKGGRCSRTRVHLHVPEGKRFDYYSSHSTGLVTNLPSHARSSRRSST